MKFSHTFGIVRTKDDDWFDPTLNIDTPLFIDPFLIYKSEFGAFQGSHAEMIEFFSWIVELIAKSAGSKGSIYYAQAIQNLHFPELEELCLGFTMKGTQGSGSGSGLANSTASATWAAIQAGLNDVRHFEEIFLFRERIGRDRVSDMTGRLLLHRFLKYTEEIVERHNLPSEKRTYAEAAFDMGTGSWTDASARLPINPFTNKPVVLVPEQYLRQLQTISLEGLKTYITHFVTDAGLRSRLNIDIASKLNKQELARIAREHSDLRNQYIDFVERRKAKAYDLRADPKGLIIPWDEAIVYCEAFPLEMKARTTFDFERSILMLVNQYKAYVENNRGYELLWNSTRHKPESAAQTLFAGLGLVYARMAGVDISREPNMGRGPVDFKFSSGYKARALIEVKLASNSKLVQGVKSQLPTYLESENIELGVYLILIFTKKDLAKFERAKSQILEAAAAVKPTAKIHVVMVDARRNKVSASKL